MLSSSGSTSHARKIATGLVASVVVTLLIAWRFGANAKEVMHGAGTGPLLLFVLGSWLLYSDFGHSGRARTIMNTLGILFTILRTTTFIRLCLQKELDSKFEPVFNSRSGISWTGWGLYTSASLFMQVLLHRVLPEWACTAVGLLHSCGFTMVSYRFQRMGADHVPLLHILRIAFFSQVAMFAPYHLFSNPYLRRQSANQKGSDKAQLASKGSGQQGVGEEHTTAGSQPKAALQSADGGKGEAADEQPCVNSSQATAKRVSNVANCSAGKVTDVAAAVHALQRAPYKSRWRMPHTVCVKLDTSLPCSSLPSDLVQQLQGALQSSIGQATSLNISGVAVRPGCICITMKIEEELVTGGEAQTADVDSHLRVHDLVQALLPQLQTMLNKEGGEAMQRSIVQLDSTSRAVCVWMEDKQTWEVQVHPMCEAAPACEDQPWLGMTTARGIEPAATVSNRTGSAFCPVEVLAEVQLWGVSKVADVEGWTPPQQHQDSELQWPGAQQPSGSSPALKLLARAAGGYLPTQVVRLVPGSTDGYVTAQVLVQLHEHQLVRHHEGGSPSTVLLMDLELWQSEVLLSSSPLLSLPTTGTTAASCTHPCTAWWWSAADSIVASAMVELHQFTQQCMQEAAESDLAAASRTCVQYQQDLALWLHQVQHAAFMQKLCQCAPQGSCSICQFETQTAQFLQQPLLATSFVCQLGQDLMQYAQLMGWQRMHHMVSQQMRVITTLKADAGAAAGHGQGRLAPYSRAAKAVLLGYTCHLDEQLYKQQLATLVTGVLLVSSTASTLIGSLMVVRALASGGIAFTCLPLSWTLLHAAAMAAMLVAFTSKQQHMRTAATQCALQITTYAYIWKAVGHLGTMLMISAAYKELYARAFQRQQLWILMKLVTLLSSQVPASVLLPAPLVTFMALLLEFPALLLDVMRSSSWHPATCVITTFLLAVGARFVLDAQLRVQLTRRLPLLRRTLESQASKHMKRE